MYLGGIFGFSKMTDIPGDNRKCLTVGGYGNYAKNKNGKNVLHRLFVLLGMVKK